VVGGGITHLLLGADSPYRPAGWIMSIVGAIVVLWVSGMFASRGPDL
jgi:uncharacterized membrane protein YeaQ/YmgE (transglycosylase-associated protein family)